MLKFGALLDAGSTGTEVVKGGMEAIIGAIPTVVEAIGTVFTAMTSNEYLTFCLASGVLGIAISKFRYLKKAA